MSLAVAGRRWWKEGAGTSGGVHVMVVLVVTW